MSNEQNESNEEMRSNAEPVIENPGMRSMPNLAARGDLTDDAQVQARAGLPDMPAPPVDVTKPTMEPVDALAPADTAEPTDQEPLAQEADPTAVGYVRIVLGYAEGRLSPVAASVVDGPLQKPHSDARWAYQAQVDGRVVGVGGLPDLLTVRGAAPQDNPGAGHSFAVAETTDFVVRIPNNEITAGDLRRISIELVDHDQSLLPLPKPGMTVQDLAIESGAEVPETLAILDGFDLDVFGETAQQIEERLGR